MENSIPLKEIVGFLPYGLKMVSSTEGRSAYDRIEKRRLKKVEEAKCSNIDFLLFLKRKPAVRPLSDLTKEITHNEKTFVPIVEIAKIADSVEKVIRMNHKKIITGFDYVNGSGEIMRFCYHHITKHFQITYVNVEEFRNECVLRQLEMFEKMYELNFDIYDWIKDGKAIDINTL